MVRSRSDATTASSFCAWFLSSCSASVHVASSSSGLTRDRTLFPEDDWYHCSLMREIISMSSVNSRKLKIQENVRTWNAVVKFFQRQEVHVLQQRRPRSFLLDTTHSTATAVLKHSKVRRSKLTELIKRQKNYSTFKKLEFQLNNLFMKLIVCAHSNMSPRLRSGRKKLTQKGWSVFAVPIRNSIWPNESIARAKWEQRSIKHK